MAFQAYGQSLETVKSFKYLRCILTATYDECMKVIVNLKKFQKSWSKLSHILGW